MIEVNGGIASKNGTLRVIGRWQIVGYSVNDVIGSGVYLLPAAAAALLGAASLWAVALAGIAVLLLVLCFAEAATYFDQPGSGYLYTRSAFGDFIGFEVGWMTWLTRVAAVASLSAGFAQAVSYWWPAAAAGRGADLMTALPLVALTGINLIGIKLGMRAAVALAIGKVIPLLILIGVGVFSASPALARSQPVTQQGGLAAAALLLLFAYAGFENTGAPAGEFRNPQRDIPFALLAQIGIVTVIYVAVQWVALGTLPHLGASATPLAEIADLLLGSWGGWLLTAGAAVSILGTTHNTVLAGSRYLFALARDGHGPGLLGQVHPRFRTPAIALLLQMSIALPLALTGTFVGLAALSVVARLVTYLGTAAAVPVLRRKFKQPAGSFRLPGGPAIPVAACGLSLFLAAGAGRANLVAAGVALVVGAVLYRFRRPSVGPVR